MFRLRSNDLGINRQYATRYRKGSTDRTLGPLSALGSLNTLGALSALRSLIALRTLRTIRAVRTIGTR